MTDVSSETFTKTSEAKEESSSSRLRDDFLTGMYGGTIALTRSIKEENVNQNQNMEELSSRRLAGFHSDPAVRQTLSQEYSNFDEKTIGINERKSGQAYSKSRR